MDFNHTQYVLGFDNENYKLVTKISENVAKHLV